MSVAYKSSRFTYEGAETTETSVTRAGGAVDPTGQAQSRKIVTTANAQWLRPFQAEPYAIWNPTTGANVVVTVCGLSGAGAAPNNDDIWLEIEYLGDASSTLGKIVSTTKANLLAANAAVPSDSSSWNVPATSFDGPSTLVVLSNGNLTVTHNNTTGNANASSTAFHSAGKYYFEVVPQVSVAPSNFMGIISSVGATGPFGLTGMSGDTTSVQMPSSVLYSNGGNTGLDLGTMALGDVFCFAIDLTARLAWIRRNNGNWNANGAANPATGVGGLTIAPALSFTPFVRFGSGLATDVMTANFGASAYAFTPPAGFANWDTGWVPFKLEKTLSAPQPGKAGYIEARARVGKAGATYYLDPKITLTPASAGTGVAASFKSSRRTYEGTETTETSVTRAGGAVDPGGQGQSRKIVTTANAQWLRPFQAEPYAIWNPTTGADVTAMVCGAVNGAALPNNDDIWLEVEYLGDASSTLGKIVTTTKSSLLAANAAVAADSSTWNVPATTLNPADKEPHITLSGGDLVATGTAGWLSNVRAVDSHGPTGKYYWECTFNTIAGSTTGFGVAVAGTPLNTGVGSSMVAGMCGMHQLGAIWSGGVGIVLSAFGTPANGTVIGIALDIASNRIWFRHGASGFWNGNASYDPATNVGGVAPFAAASACYPMVGTSGADTITSNFGASPFVGAVPSGFTSGWPAVLTPFKLEKTLSAPRPGLAGYLEARVRVGKPSTTYYIDPTVTLS